MEITSHNHGFAVDPDSLNLNEVDVTHVNLNDQTLEGFRHRNQPVFCVQYHPEAAPGPHDSHYSASTKRTISASINAEASAKNAE